MKLNVADTNVLIGKRVTIGAAISSVIAVLVYYFPDHAVPMVAAGVPITFAVQVWMAHNFQITNHDH